MRNDFINPAFAVMFEISPNNKSIFTLKRLTKLGVISSIKSLEINIHVESRKKQLITAMIKNRII